MTSNNVGFGDTTLTKVFVGGLAWETPKEALRDHFDKFGDILEAVIISDKLTGRSKGYGFVTFKDDEAAKKACEDPAPVINGRRANCNLASLGARRPRSSVPVAVPHHNSQHGSNGVQRSTSAAPSNHVQWYYPANSPAYHHQAVPFYGYAPTYLTTNVNYNHKLSYSGGQYMNGQAYSGGQYMNGQAYPAGQAIMGASAVMPMYPLYHFNQSHAMGLPAHHIFPQSTAPITAVPAIISKPPPMAVTPVMVTMMVNN